MQWQEHLLHRDDGSTFFCRTVGEGQPLLLIHGAAVDSEFFYVGLGGPTTHVTSTVTSVGDIIKLAIEPVG